MGILIQVISVTIIITWYCNATTLPQRDICSKKQPSRTYLVMGERGIITANNITYSIIPNKNVTQAECKVELVTCATCVIYIRFRNLTQLPQVCDSGADNRSCPCDHVWISESPNNSRLEFCRSYSFQPNVYRSQTRYLNIGFTYSTNYKQAFTIEYVSERNRQFLKGSPGPNNLTYGGDLKSPFFPSVYPKDLGAEYVISCQQTAIRCRIKLIFTDFLVSTQSIIEFFDWTGQRVRVSSGAKPRPPVVVSTGPSLLIRFFANGAAGLGYKASYYFVTGSINERTLIPITDCGGEVENYGGGITMMNMVQEEGALKKYDCVWLIKPNTNYLNNNIYLYASVVGFQNMVGEAEVKIYEGLTSEGPVLETVRSPAPRPRPQHVTQVTSGFYVSLKATFSQSSRLVIAYAVFSNMDCFMGADFFCQNHRCIAGQLYCDGFDHCGDNSDEPDTCSQDWNLEPVDRRWYSHIPNYYFPKADRYSDLKTATLVFVLSSIGLVFLIAALVMLLYRMGVRARQQRELQSRLQTISNFLEGAQIEEVEVSDEPPNYEPPPDYAEIMKKEIKRRKSSRRKSSRGRSVKIPKAVVPDSPPPPYLDAQANASGESSGNGQHHREWASFTSCLSEPSTSDYFDDSVIVPPEARASPEGGETRRIYDLARLWNLLPGSSARGAGPSRTEDNQECGCEGACGCAGQSTRGRSESVNIPFMAATWSPATARVLNLFRQHKAPSSIKATTSADNLPYLQ